MTCRSVRKLLPLAAGGDLAGGKAGRVAAHLEACAACRAALEAYLSAISLARGLDDAAGRTWSEAAWSRAVRRAVDQGRAPAPRPRVALKPAVLAAAGLVLVAVAALLLVLSRHPLRTREVIQARTPAAPIPEQETPATRDSVVTPEAPLVAARGAGPSHAPVERALTGAPATSDPPAPVQDVVSATFVSQETGLKIVWFFDRNFDWKGEGR